MLVAVPLRCPRKGCGGRVFVYLGGLTLVCKCGWLFETSDKGDSDRASEAGALLGAADSGHAELHSDDLGGAAGGCVPAD
jgi:hypothetical protein